MKRCSSLLVVAAVLTGLASSAGGCIPPSADCPEEKPGSQDLRDFQERSYELQSLRDRDGVHRGPRDDVYLKLESDSEVQLIYEDDGEVVTETYEVTNRDEFALPISVGGK